VSFDSFRKEVWKHYRRRGRDLPWRRTRDPYKVLVSEVMLQQTQVSRVVPKYRLFLKTFPDFRALDRASLRRVLRAWQGLGYNRRALNLKRLAAVVVRDYGGKLPADLNSLENLPGVGRATAGAVLAFALNKPTAFLETNIRRVFIHFFFPRRRKVRDSEILRLVERMLDPKNPREWYWALMDYGANLRATLSLSKGGNPNRKSIHYTKQSPFRGSNRELRGEILKLLTRRPRSVRGLEGKLGFPPTQVRKVIGELVEEGFAARRGRRVEILTR